MLSTLPNLCQLIHFDLRTFAGSRSEFTNHWEQNVWTEEESNLLLTTLTDAIRLTSAKLGVTHYAQPSNNADRHSHGDQRDGV